MTLTPVTESIKDAVASSVRSLAGHDAECRHGREAHEKIEQRTIVQRFVQIDCALDLRSYHSVPICSIRRLV